MKGHNMKAAKERKMDRKRKHKALAVAKTEKSRQRRLDNKAKRAEIHAIDPDMKVRVINQVTHDEDGAEIKIENGKIVKWLPQANPVPETVEVFDKETMENKLLEIIKIKPTVEVFEPDPEEHKKGRTIDDQVEKERLGVFNPFRWRKK